MLTASPEGRSQEIEAEEIIHPEATSLIKDLLKPPTLLQRLKSYIPSGKFSKSALANGLSFLGYEAAITAAGGIGWYSAAFNPDWNDPVTKTALILSTSGIAVSVFLNGEANVKMLRTKGVEFSTSIVSTFLYDMSHKYMPVKKELAADVSVRLSSYIWDVSKQVGIWGVSTIYSDPNSVIYANVVGTVLNMAQAGAGHYLLTRRK